MKEEGNGVLNSETRMSKVRSPYDAPGFRRAGITLRVGKPLHAVTGITR
jgi:hypothetical protein